MQPASAKVKKTGDALALARRNRETVFRKTIELLNIREDIVARISNTHERTSFELVEAVQNLNEGYGAMKKAETEVGDALRANLKAIAEEKHNVVKLELVK
jgi:hypothetical protein